MIWNTIAHPKMMTNHPGGGGSTITFSKEALESPIKHMNRDLLATFDYIIWRHYTSISVPEANKFSKTTFLIGDFESLFVAGKNKTIVNGLLIGSELGIRLNPDTKVTEYYPIENDAGMNYSIYQFPLIIPKSLYGKMTVGNHELDFGKDSFVMMSGEADILISSSGEMLFGNEAELVLLKYIVHEESSGTAHR